MNQNLRNRLENYIGNASNREFSESEKSSENANRNGHSSFEETGFNIIKMIKVHLSHGTPLMFHVVRYYYRFRRNRLNRFFFWILAYVGQIVDMSFSILYGILMFVIAVIVVIAIARGIGVGDFIIQLVKVLHS